MLYELKSRDVERRFLMCELLLQRQKRKCFLHRIITGDEKWIHYDNPKRKKSWGMPGHASTSSPKPNIHGSKLLLCIWWDQQGIIYYELHTATKNQIRCNRTPYSSNQLIGKRGETTHYPSRPYHCSRTGIVSFKIAPLSNTRIGGNRKYFATKYNETIEICVHFFEGISRLLKY